MSARTPSPFEQIVGPQGSGSRQFLAFLEELRKQQEASLARIEALIAHLEDEEIIAPGWDA
jgi:hypothetical protein